jgi:hypothetical protein
MKVPILGWTIDERFLAHRQRSTSIGAMAGVLVAGGLFFYNLLVLDTIEWGFFAIVAVAAAVKMAVLLWSILTH